MDRLFNQFEKFKKLSNSDFKRFKVYDITKDRIRDANKELDEIIFNSSASDLPNRDMFDLVLIEFFNEDGREDFFSNTSMTKKLCWVLDYSNRQYDRSIIESGLLTTALDLIDRKFTPSMYSGLINILFSNWTDPKIERLRKYVQIKLSFETNQRSKVLFFQNHLHFFSSFEGPEKWATYVFNGKHVNVISFFENNPAVDYLKRTEYFKIFVISLYESVLKQNDIGDRYKWQTFIEFAQEYFEPSLIKYLIALEIFHFRNQISDGSLKDKIKNRAISVIGDPIKKSNWLLEHHLLTPQRKHVVNEVRNILNHWINETLINLFFSNVVDDYDRRSFWKQYIDKMASVDIFLRSNSLYGILTDERVKDGLESRFGVLNSGGNTNSVLIFTIDRFRFVLAGSIAGGALYVHPEGSPYFPNIEGLKIDTNMWGYKLRSINKYELVHSHLPSLIEQTEYSFYLNNEGRMVHTGNWKSRLKRWMDKKIG